MGLGLALCGSLALGVLTGPRTAHADPVVFELTETMAADWHWTLDDPQIEASGGDDANIFDLRNRLNLRLRTGEWTFGLRLDLALFADPPSPQYRNDIRPEEMFVTWRGEHWTLTAGDDYLTLGRGLALSLRKFDEVGFATNLRGAHARFRTTGFETRFGVGFTNVVNVDSVDEKKVPDPADVVALARLETDALGPVTVGVNVVDIERRHSNLRNALTGPLYDDTSADPGDPGYRIQGRRQARTLIVGGDLKARLADKVDLQLDGAWLENQATRETLSGDVPADSHGLALYGAVTATFGRWTALLEGKHYDHWKVESSLHPDTADAQGITQVFPYVAPPSLERIDQRVVNNSDVTGVHLRVDHTFDDNARGDRNVLFVSSAFFVDAPAEDEWTLHAYLGWERNTKAGERLSIQTGYRREEAPDAAAGGLTRLGMWHLDLDWTRTVAAGVDLQLHWAHEIRQKNVGVATLAESYFEGTFYATLSLPPTWSFTLQTEYLTAESEPSPYYFGAFLQWKPSSADLVRLFVGRSKGGLKCSGGVCRIFPDFEGVKLETTLRF
ncbi:MAG: hypothetical protein JNJ59_19045 [Deltaproteobacteria bacterium]|nr:hypothetical protein [Deltaproteobacteria bacterium]